MPNPQHQAFSKTLFSVLTSFVSYPELQYVAEEHTAYVSFVADNCITSIKELAHLKHFHTKTSFTSYD